MSRFDYVKYDEQATAAQAEFKAAYQAFEASLLAMAEAGYALSDKLDKLPYGRARDLANAKITQLTETSISAPEGMVQLLEESYMWVGKALRNDQIRRNNGKAELQEGRGNE